MSSVAEQIRREVPSEVLPEGNTDLLFLMYAVLALTVGESISAEHVHDAWAAWMTWEDPSHESIKSFDELDSETRGEDAPYVQAIRRVALQLSSK